MGRGGTGVTPRDNSIQLAFTWQGKLRRETLRMDGVILPPTAPNLKLAHRTMKEVRAAIAAGTFDYAEHFPDSKHASAKDSGALTFGKACADYLDACGQLAKKTRDQYRNALNFWKGLLGADTPLASMKHSTLRAKIGKHPWASAKLMNNYLIPLRGVFKMHLRDLKISNPLDGIENAKHQKPGPDPLTPDEREKVLADMAKHYSPKVYAYQLFAFMTGLRPQEQIALRWSDIDWNHKTALIQRAKVAGDLKPLKTYQTRHIDLTPRALEALAIMRPHTSMLRDDPEVFQNPVTMLGWHDERSQRDHYWTPSLKRCGIRARRAYCARHTFATTALMGGVKAPYIARQMGHKSVKILLETYAKWIDGADGNAERRQLEAAMGAKPQTEIAPELHRASGA